MSASRTHTIAIRLLISQQKWRIRGVHTVSSHHAVTHQNGPGKHTIKKSLQISYGTPHMLNDVKFRFDNKYLKKSAKDLDRNIEWLKSVNTFEGYVGEQGETDDAKELFIVLDRLDKVSKLQDGYTTTQLNQYLDTKQSLIENVRPYMTKVAPDFRRKHVLTNSLVEHTYNLLMTNLEHVNTDTLIKYFDFLAEINLEELNAMIEELYLQIYERLSDSYNEDNIQTKIKVTCKITDMLETDRIREKIEELLLDAVCNDIAFRKNMTELMQIIYSYHLRPNANRFIMEYMELYTQKLMSYAHTLSNDEIISALYLLYKLGWAEVATFNKMAEAALFRVNTLTYEQMVSLASLLAGFKYLFAANSSDLGETIYSEGVRMLTSMIREYFEDKLVNLRLTKMLDPLVNITALTKVTARMKELTVAKLDRDLVEGMNPTEFQKLLLALGTMRIGKTNDKVSRLVRGYIAANDRLMLGDELSDDQKAHLVVALRNFVPKKHYNRYIHSVLRGLVERSLGPDRALLDERSGPLKLEISTNSKLVMTLLQVYVTNRLHRLEGPDSNVTKVLGTLASSCVTDKGSGLTTVGIDHLVILLKTLYYSQLQINQVRGLVKSIFERILDAVKQGTSLRVLQVNDMMSFALHSRIVVPGFAEFVRQTLENRIAGLLGGVRYLEVGTHPTLVATYLRCVRFLGLDIERNDLLNTYEYLLETVGRYEPGPGQMSTKGNCLGELLLGLKELMMWEQVNDPDVYKWLVERTSPATTEHLNILEAFPCTKGKLHEALRRRVDGFESYGGEGAFKFDLYSAAERKAIHIMRREDYFMGEGGDVYPKHRPRLAELAARSLGIGLKLVPEHFLSEEEHTL